MQVETTGRELKLVTGAALCYLHLQAGDTEGADHIRQKIDDITDGDLEEVQDALGNLVLAGVLAGNDVAPELVASIREGLG